MSEMIERCALAMANSDCRRLDLPELASVEEFRFEHDYVVYKELARAAIEAMREMNEPALEKAVSAHLDWRPTKDTPRTPCQDFGMQQREILTYQTKAALGAYFDAALSQDTHSPSPLNPPADTTSTGDA